VPFDRREFAYASGIHRIMILAFLLAASALFAQNNPQLTNQNGTIVGVLRNTTGGPAVGVRVSAMARPDSVNDVAASSAFAALGETDDSGRYRLDNVPPGRYYIVAGRVDAPTYYPGTVQLNEGTIVQITPGAAVSGIDFVLNNGSVGRANSDFAGNAAWVIPIQTRIEGGGKVPLFAGGKFPVLRLTRFNGVRTDVALNTPSVTLTEPAGQTSAVEYRVTMEDLPETYTLKSLAIGSTDLSVDSMQLVPRASSGATVMQSIVVTLAGPASAPPAGVRVSGRIQGDSKRSVYLSGNSGTFYADGTFEFVGVLPGRHTIVSVDSQSAARSLGATLTVGDRDLPDLELDVISTAPAHYDQPAKPLPSDGRLPGTRGIPVSIRGRVSDSGTSEPFNAGKVIINGNYSMPFQLNDEGRFEIPKLLPGNYEVEVFVYGIGMVNLAVALDDQDVSLELTLAP